MNNLFKLCNLFWQHREKYNFIPIDRFRGNNIYKDTFPKTTKMNLQEICLETVKQNTKCDVVLFSYGIDSLTVISSFIEYGIKPSVLTFPTNEFNSVILNDLKKMGINEVDYKTFKVDNHFIVDGSMGDSCFYSSSEPPSWCNYQESTLKYLLSCDDIKDVLNSVIIPIKNVSDLIFYIGWVYRARKSAFHHGPMLVASYTGQKTNWNKRKSFFYGELFDDYIFSNFDMLRAEKGYKEEFKKIILKLPWSEESKQIIQSMDKVESVRNTLRCPMNPHLGYYEDLELRCFENKIIESKNEELPLVFKHNWRDLIWTDTSQTINF